MTEPYVSESFLDTFKEQIEKDCEEGCESSCDLLALVKCDKSTMEWELAISYINMRDFANVRTSSGKTLRVHSTIFP